MQVLCLVHKVDHIQHKQDASTGRTRNHGPSAQCQGGPFSNSLHQFLTFSRALLVIPVTANQPKAESVCLGCQTQAEKIQKARDSAGRAGQHIGDGGASVDLLIPVCKGTELPMWSSSSIFNRGSSFKNHSLCCWSLSCQFLSFTTMYLASLFRASRNSSASSLHKKRLND
ncbi:hypothetical protein P7K49_002871 [Saguinus oedipus]|uniref:Uncharacterized protein n=1 Tax=Saguinus oedipus TaxID=9490 RepID=A0ABQ9WJ41_SAGOE|nr:hypothetical protein P7K49_002871 [Saguinus oedipus]